MPELIDLEISKENILGKVNGERLVRAEFPVEKVLQNVSVDAAKKAIEGRALDDITRKAKTLVFHFEEKSLVIHLMLHGEYCWLGGGASGQQTLFGGTPEKNVVCSLSFENGVVLAIKDWSRWTRIELHDPEHDVVSEMMERAYGPDPLSDEFSEEVLEAILQEHGRKGIKKVLMDQSILAGVGNAYADETLWEAYIHPSTRCSKIVETGKAGVLFSAMNTVLDNSLEEVRQLAGGEEVVEQDRAFMKVYRKSGQKCPRCKYMIACLKVNSRDTFVCEKCQEKM